MLQSTMVVSERAKALRNMSSVLKECETLLFAGYVLEDEDMIECAESLVLVYTMEMERMESIRYIDRGRYRQTTMTVLDRHLHDNQFLSNAEFLAHYRMTRVAFWELVRLIEHHPVFVSTPGRRSQFPVQYQLMLFLRVLGTEGNGACNKILGRVYEIGAGTCAVFTRRCKTAILSLKPQVLCWLSPAEKDTVKKNFLDEYDIPGCVGVADGTLLPLAFAPTMYPESFYTRKGNYALNSLVVVDHVGRIIHHYTGWPGSVHDNRVWKSSQLFLESEKFFSDGEYILGDSAFQSTAIMVPIFRNERTCVIKQRFNHIIKKPRVKSEHAIGMVKGRFPMLRSLRVKIDSKRTLVKAVQMVNCCYILHNLLIQDHFDATWFEGEDNDDEDAATLDILYDDNDDVDPDDRREQLVRYLADKYSW